MNLNLTIVESDLTDELALDDLSYIEPRDRTEPERRRLAYWNRYMRYCDRQLPKWPDNRDKASKRSGHRHVASMLGMQAEPNGLVRIACPNAETACRYRGDLYKAMKALGLLGPMNVWRSRNTVVIRKAPVRVAAQHRGDQNSHDQYTPNRRDCQCR